MSAETVSNINSDWFYICPDSSGSGVLSSKVLHSEPTECANLQESQLIEIPDDPNKLKVSDDDFDTTTVKLPEKIKLWRGDGAKEIYFDITELRAQASSSLYITKGFLYIDNVRKQSILCI